MERHLSGWQTDALIPTPANKLDFQFLRDQMIGADARITTPFSERLMAYGDYTASGRCLRMFERYVAG